LDENGSRDWNWKPFIGTGYFKKKAKPMGGGNFTFGIRKPGLLAGPKSLKKGALKRCVPGKTEF